MNIFKFVYGSRGAGNFARRALQVGTRFGPGPGKMSKRFSHFLDIMDKYECRPTFPVTALPMKRNPGVARLLLERGAELAVHAYTHVALSSLGREEQSLNIGKAIHVFRKLGIPFVGFRAPYLRWNDDTMKVVEDYGFKYSSNQAVIWDVLDRGELDKKQRDALDRGTSFYSPLKADQIPVLPYKRRGFVEIPVSLPDDEILLDRMYLCDSGRLCSVWTGILDKTYERGELFTVQLHPERIEFFCEPLENLLRECRSRNPGVWVTTLGEIANWWNEKTCNSVEFVREGPVTSVRVNYCPGTYVYVREEGKDRRVVEDHFTLKTDKLPCVGVSAGSERRVLQHLRDRGYWVEIGDADDFSIHLGMIENGANDKMRSILEFLEKFEGPLVKFGTWPNGCKSALAVTGDIDALTVWDFINRLRGA